jgi:heme/copper-type cytochrome/quinol oxidase subunit 2
LTDLLVAQQGELAHGLVEAFQRFLRGVVDQGVAVLFVMVMVNATVSLIRNFINPKVRIPSYMFINATWVTVTDLVMAAYSRDVYKQMGLYIMLIVAFAIPAWAARVDAFPSESAATGERVVAEQFAWNAHYPGADGQFGRTDIKLVAADNPLGLDRSDPAAKDDFNSVNQLALPVNAAWRLFFR